MQHAATALPDVAGYLMCLYTRTNFSRFTQLSFSAARPSHLEQRPNARTSELQHELCGSIGAADSRV